jgi:O-6-methylguanine DNA methyltransferase
MKSARHETFGALTDELIQTGRPAGASATEFAAELAVARRLRETAPAGIADPEYLASLRDELRVKAEARSRTHTGQVRCAALDTPFGLLAFAYQSGSVIYCARLDAFDAGGASIGRANGVQAAMEVFARAAARDIGVLPERDERLPLQLERAILRQLAGRGHAPVDLSRVPQFQRRVLEKTAEIPRGEVRPYGWIASEIGVPGATRAVGTALGHNPIPFLIPCHRVVRSDGSIGEYSGGGPAVKERVLAIEGAPVVEMLEASKSRRRFMGSRTTHIVCYPSCHAARRIRDEHRIAFASLAQARDDGYRPCALCRPT